MAQTQPERPTTGVTPFLSISGGRAQEALDFYGRAFGAKVIERNLAQDGKRLMQGSMKLNGGWVMLSDEFPEQGYAAKPPASVTLHLQVDDADHWWKRALDAGCEVALPIADQFWGDRYGQVKDPFGHAWSIGSPLK
ncbi:MAG: VOC family protein [Caulobacteraceae bacterium]